MKSHTLTALCTIACAAIATAQVPSLINYQGRLTDANGDPVTGSKNFAISIYDAATNGTLLYTETIGAVTLDDNGLYSFQFGGSGTSNTLVTETVATTNGTSTTFQKVLDNSPVVANSVSVSDGTYTWSQSAGSSNEDQFGVAYSTSLRRVTANYYNGAPAIGRTITTTYRYGTSGITGALASGAEHWMAVSVDGTTQGTRQRVLAVPFATNASHAVHADFAAYATSAESVAPRTGVQYAITQLYSPPESAYARVEWPFPSCKLLKSPVAGASGSVTGGGKGIFNIPKTTMAIERASCAVNNKSVSGRYAYNNSPTVTTGYTKISIRAKSGIGELTTIATQTINGTLTGVNGELVLNGPFVLDQSNYDYYIQVEVGAASTNGEVYLTSDMDLAYASNLILTVKTY
jgi:hypothetical protein